MDIEKLLKCKLTKAEEQRFIDAIKKGTHTFEDLVDLMNSFVDEAFQSGVNYGDGHD